MGLEEGKEECICILRGRTTVPLSAARETTDVFLEEQQRQRARCGIAIFYLLGRYLYEVRTEGQGGQNLRTNST